MIKTLKSKVRFEAAVFLNFMNRATKQFVETQTDAKGVFTFSKRTKNQFFNSNANDMMESLAYLENRKMEWF